ncbi:MAG: hypothetical protein AAF438_07970 [Pseudomonadota bacterium]
MKTNLNRLWVVVIALMVGGMVQAQNVQTINQEGKIVVDRVGRADMSFKTEMNASNWQNWMQTYGNAQHVLKRDMKSEFSIYHVNDFAITKNEADRNFTMSFAADGAGVYRGNDTWEMEIEEGRVTKLNEKQWLLQMTQTDTGVLIQQNFTIELPEEVSSSIQAKGELGEDVIRYVIPGSAGSSMPIWYGALLTLLGLSVLVAGFLKKEPPLLKQENAIPVSDQSVVGDGRVVEGERQEV